MPSIRNKMLYAFSLVDEIYVLAGKYKSLTSLYTYLTHMITKNQFFSQNQ